MKEEIEKLKSLFNKTESNEISFENDIIEYREILNSLQAKGITVDNWLNDLPNLANRTDIKVEIVGVMSYLTRRI